MRTTKVWKQPKCVRTVQANCGDYRGSLMTLYQRQWVRRSFMSQVHVHTWPAMMRGGTWRTRKKQGSGSRGKPFSPPCWPLCGDDWCMISVEDIFDFWVKGQSLGFVWLVVAAFWEGIISLPTQGMPPAKLQWCTQRPMTAPWSVPAWSSRFRWCLSLMWWFATTTLCSPSWTFCWRSGREVLG